ncbi:transposase DDE domain protein [mine drainage metagenome]|uniref:Transposase DDE domain protein n=1 Tax=mine drainage metagenome TaxID=410659 RepID=A0A1J5QHN7_9ZZZZ
MFIVEIPNRNSPPAILLREGWREGSKVHTRTLANLSHLAPEKIEALKAALKGGSVTGAVPIPESSLPHGHVLAVAGMMDKLGLPKLLFGKRHHMRELALALVAGRVIEPGSKLSLAQALAKGAEHHSLGEVLGLGELGKAIDPENPGSSQEKRAAGEFYAAMDWLLERQAKVEDALAKRHLSSGCTVLYDLSSSYFEGSTCPLAKYGYSRDHRKDRPQVQYGLLCNEDGIPVAIEVVEGNTGDPKTIPAQVARLKERFGLERVVVVGDRGMVTEARIREDIATVGYDWISALVHKSIQPLVAAKVITPSLFDERGLGEITHPDYPGERLIACFNPIRAEDQVRKREELLALTEKGLKKVADACRREKKPLQGVTEIGLKTGAALAKFRMAKFFSVRIHECGMSWQRKPELLAKDAAMDGIYVIRTSLPQEAMGAEQAVLTYKRLAKVERAFRTMKSVDLQVRPIYHRTEERVKAHLFICMLAYYVEWHLREAWAPLLYTDEEGSQRDTPVSPVQASESGRVKKKRAHTADGLPLQSFSGLMKSLATLCQNRIRLGEKGPLYTRATRPTPLQAKAFGLIGVAIP